MPQRPANSALARMGDRLRFTLSYGDIYGRILAWLLSTFLSLAVAAALADAEHPLAGLGVIGMVLALSLPFLLFAFATTLASHIAVIPLADQEEWPRLLSSIQHAARRTIDCGGAPPASHRSVLPAPENSLLDSEPEDRPARPSHACWDVSQ